LGPWGTTGQLTMDGVDHELVVQLGATALYDGINGYGELPPQTTVWVTLCILMVGTQNVDTFTVSKVQGIHWSSDLSLTDVPAT